MENGWIKLHRSIFDNISFNNEKCFKIWIWCLLKANHKDNVFLLGREKISLKKGQFVMGSKKESEFLNIAKSTLWFWLEFLEKEGQLELKKTNKYTIISIPNWKKYQVVELKSNSNDDTDGTQIGTNKNDNNDKKEKNITETGSVGINELIKTFESINPSCSKYYGNKTQRKACENLISNYGFNRVKKVIEVTLPKTNTLPFFPSITTPVQLQEKWSSLESAIRKYQSKQHTEQTKKGMALW